MNSFSEKNLFFGQITCKPARQLYSRASLRRATRLQKSDAHFPPPASLSAWEESKKGPISGDQRPREPRNRPACPAAAAHHFCFPNLSSGEHHQLCTRITGAWRGSATERPIMTMNNSDTYAPCSFHH